MSGTVSKAGQEKGLGQTTAKIGLTMQKNKLSNFNVFTICLVDLSVFLSTSHRHVANIQA